MSVKNKACKPLILSKFLLSSHRLISHGFHTLFTLSLIVVLFGISNTYAENGVSHPKMGIMQIVEHPALNEVRAGVMEALKKQGFESNKNISILYENAQGNITLSAQIATKILSENPDLVISISTPSAQAALHAAKRSNSTVPIVFTAVSDYKAAHLEPGAEHYPITGITDTPDLAATLELMSEIMPKMKTLGLLYNPAEQNSVSTVQKLKVLLEAKGIKTQEATVNSTTEVAEAVRSLMGNVDALYFPQDNTVVSAIDTVVQLKPGAVFCNVPSLVEKGILGAVGYDYKEIGKETGELALRILKGEQAATIAVEHPKELQSRVNTTLASKLGLSIPAQLKQSEIQKVESK